MKLYVKNMVCNRCILVVQQELNKLGLKDYSVSLGQVNLQKDPSPDQLDLLRAQLAAVGFELLDDAKKKMIEKIKQVIIEQVHDRQGDESQNFSAILSGRLHKDYSYLSGLFSEVEGITIEKYIIHQKIEKAKELIIYDELNLSEIADRLGYSSVAHLSNQFKKVTGLSPRHFKKLGWIKRKPIDQV